MKKILHSGWLSGLLGTVLYLGTTAMLLSPAKVLQGVHARAESGEDTSPKPSWEFSNPELDRLIAELKKEKESLATREQQLSELAARLQAERAELNQVTQTVHQLQMEFEKGVLRVREEETANLKKTAKMYAAMSPDGAAPIVKQLEDDQILKFLVFMKDNESGPLLEYLGRLGSAEAKRAAALTERLRTTLYRNQTPKQP